MINLREFLPEDASALVELLNNHNVTRYLSSRMPTPYSEDDANWWISTGSKVGIVRAITLNDELIGCVGAEPGLFEGCRSAEIGYWLGEPFWGAGYAGQATNALTDMIFSTTDIVRIYGTVFDPNKASMHVLEKCGFQREGIFHKACYKNGEFYDKHVFAKVQL